MSRRDPVPPPRGYRWTTQRPRYEGAMLELVLRPIVDAHLDPLLSESVERPTGVRRASKRILRRLARRQQDARAADDLARHIAGQS